MPYIDCFSIGSYGQSIRCTIKERSTTTGALAVVDITSATSLKIVFRTPSGETISKTATLVNSGSDGKLGYTVEDGFFDAKNKKLIGTWSYQPDFVLGSWSGSANEVGHFKVVDRLKKP